MHYGPEKFNDGMLPELKMKLPDIATQVMFINGGLNSMKLDDVNYGLGFNLNLLCFKMTDANGDEKCYHWT